ncbi:hypothetical protein JOM56_014656 [Amanita muscaria]
MGTDTDAGLGAEGDWSIFSSYASHFSMISVYYPVGAGLGTEGTSNTLDQTLGVEDTPLPLIVPLPSARLQSIPRSKLIELISLRLPILFFTLSEFRSDETRGAHGHVSEIWPFYEQISYRRIAMPVRSDETRGVLGHVLEISPFYEQISYRRIAMPVSWPLLVNDILLLIRTIRAVPAPVLQRNGSVSSPLKK